MNWIDTFLPRLEVVPTKEEIKEAEKKGLLTENEVTAWELYYEGVERIERLRDWKNYTKEFLNQVQKDAN